MLDPHPSGPDLRQQSVLIKKNENKTRLISNVAGTVLRSVNNHGLTGDGVCDRHEGGVQSGGHAPHGVVSHNPSEAKGGDHLSERCVGRDESQSQTGGNTCGDRAGESIRSSSGTDGHVPCEEMEQFYQPNMPVYFLRGYASAVIHSFFSENHLSTFRCTTKM